jgi:hypothetical protein
MNLLICPVFGDEIGNKSRCKIELFNYFGSGRAKFALPKDRRLIGTQGRQANDTIRKKRKEYEKLCNLAPADKRLFFTPFVLESTGYLHEDAVNLLNLLAKRTVEYQLAMRTL